VKSGAKNCDPDHLRVKFEPFVLFLQMKSFSPRSATGQSCQSSSALANTQEVTVNAIEVGRM
jgi:hypothetical protein